MFHILFKCAAADYCIKVSVSLQRKKNVAEEVAFVARQMGGLLVLYCRIYRPGGPHTVQWMVQGDQLFRHRWSGEDHLWCDSTCT